MSQCECTATLNASGLLCPLPVLKARKTLKTLSSGQTLKLITTDPAAAIDVPHFCNETGHHLLDVSSEGETTIYVIEKPEALLSCPSSLAICTDPSIWRILLSPYRIRFEGICYALA